VDRSQLRILSIGCGDKPYRVAGGKIARGGIWHWRDIINGAMRLQSQNALGQASLLISPENLVRIDVPKEVPRIELDDWRAAIARLPIPAAAAVASVGDRIASMFLAEPVAAYVPIMTL
jgi:hypothetical protein